MLVHIVGNNFPSKKKKKKTARKCLNLVQKDYTSLKEYKQLHKVKKKCWTSCEFVLYCIARTMSLHMLFILAKSPTLHLMQHAAHALLYPAQDWMLSTRTTRFYFLTFVSLTCGQSFETHMKILRQIFTDTNFFTTFNTLKLNETFA